MTTTDTATQPETTTVGGFANVDTLKAACVCALTGADAKNRTPALGCVALVLNGDRFEVQATDSHVAFWTGDKPADAGHHLVDAKDLGDFLRTSEAKGLVAISIADSKVTITAGTTSTSLPVCDASYPRLAYVLPTFTGEIPAISLSNLTMSKVIAVSKALGADSYELAFCDTLKPVTVRFHGIVDAQMVIMPVRS